MGLKTTTDIPVRKEQGEIIIPENKVVRVEDSYSEEVTQLSSQAPYLVEHLIFDESDPTFMDEERRSHKLVKPALEEFVEMKEDQESEILAALDDAKSLEDFLFILKWTKALESYFDKGNAELNKTAEEVADILGWFRNRNEWKKEIETGQREFLKNSFEFKLNTGEKVKQAFLEKLKETSNDEIKAEFSQEINKLNDFEEGITYMQNHLLNIKEEMMSLHESKDLPQSVYNVGIDVASVTLNSKLQILAAAKAPVLDKVFGKNKTKAVLMALTAPIKKNLKAQVESVQAREGRIKLSNEEMKKAMEDSIEQALLEVDYVNTDEYLNVLKAELIGDLDLSWVGGYLKDINNFMNKIPIVGTFTEMFKDIIKTGKKPLDLAAFTSLLLKHQKDSQNNLQSLLSEKGKIEDDLIQDILKSQNKGK